MLTFATLQRSVLSASQFIVYAQLTTSAFIHETFKQVLLGDILHGSPWPQRLFGCCAGQPELGELLHHPFHKNANLIDVGSANRLQYSVGLPLLAGFDYVGSEKLALDGELA